MIDGDLSVSFPSRGVIRLQSRSLFGDVEGPACRRFVERVSRAPEIVEITIGRQPAPHADLRFRPGRSRLDRVVERVVALLRQGPGDGEPHSNGHVSSNGRQSPVAAWQVQLDQPGRLRLKNRALYRKSELCQAIERELMSILGIDQYRTSSFFCTVQVDYDPGQLDRRQVIEILDAALAAAEHPTRLDKLDLHLPICTASLPIAAAAQFAVPALLPVAAAVFAYTSIPTFREARNVLVEERRLGVDVLDAIVVIGCLGTMAIFPGAVLCWCLSFGRVLVKRTQDNSKKMLLNAFGKQPRYAWLYRDGTEVQVPLDRLQVGDLIVVNTGEVVPVDGHVVEGMAMIDQHALTGELTPAEKGVGDRVFAATLMVAGKVFVSVETAGSETASAKIGRILNDTAGYKLSSQHRGERLADKAVIPTLCHRRRRPGHDGAGRRGGGAQQRLRHGNPHGRPAGDAQLAGAVRPQGHPGQGRPGAGGDERGRYGPLRQDRHADPRAARGRADHRLRRFHARAHPPVRGGRRAEVPPPDRHGDPAQGPGAGPDPAGRPTTPSTRSATESPSMSKAIPSESAADGSSRPRGSRRRPRSARRSRRRTARATRW